MAYTGLYHSANGGGANLPVYLSARNLKPFVDADIALAPFEPIEYMPPPGGPGSGPNCYPECLGLR